MTYYTEDDYKRVDGLISQILRLEYLDRRRRLDRDLAEWRALPRWKQIMWTILSI